MPCPCGNPNCDGPLDHGSMASLIAEHGFAVLGIMDQPPFSYTVGLTVKSLPELVVFGLPMGVAHGFFHAVVPRLEAGDLKAGSIVDDLARGNMRTAFVRVPSAKASGEYLLQARAFFDRDLDVLQMVWSDENGILPWEPRFNTKFAGVQDAIVSLRRAPVDGGYEHALH